MASPAPDSPVARGQLLFTTSGLAQTGCAPCHGANGQGGNGIPGNAGASTAVIQAALQMDPMKPLFGALTTAQIDDLAAYLATLH